MVIMLNKEINTIITAFELINGIFLIIFGRFGLYINAKITFTYEFETFKVNHFSYLHLFISCNG
jgi:hypothetical protein